MFQEKNSGFSLVEVVLASSIFVMIVTAIVGAIIYGRESTSIAGSKTRAVSLADEGLEVVRNMRDENFSNLVNGPHGLASSSGQWIFSGTSDTSDVFTRQLTIGTVDSKRKTVTSTISWQQTLSRPGLLSLTTRLTNWMAYVLGNWAPPTIESSLNVAGNEDGLKVQTQGDYAYFVRLNGSPDFVVVNISTTTSPTVVGFLTLPVTPTNLYIQGNYAYISASSTNQELEIVDISSSTSPTLISSFDAPGLQGGTSVYVSGTLAYLTRAGGASDELVIIDVSTPSSPSFVGSQNLGSNAATTARDVVVMGSYAYVASQADTQELQVVNVSTPSTPSLAGSLNLSGTTDSQSVTGFGNTILLGRLTSGLHIINVSTPTIPALQGTFAAGGVLDISLGNNNIYAFLATNNTSAEFRVVNISIPASPANVGFVNTSALNGVAYSYLLDRAIVVGSANAAELMLIAPL